MNNNTGQKRPGARVPIAFLAFLAVSLLSLIAPLQATEIHVATTGNDANSGDKSAPLRTIQHAAERAQPGDTVIVHAGVYRERVNPPRGGSSNEQRIVFEAASGEKVEIKGSEVIKGWEKVENDIWRVILPNTFFGDFNPYREVVRGDWFRACKRVHHTGAVYLNGEWLSEADKIEEIFMPIATAPRWFGQVGEKNSTILAQFPGANPNEAEVEINARQSVFYPDKPGRNYITVRGFTMCHAATPWAPPTAEQIGLIGTNWSKGWIIENNTISHSMCVGVTLGKYGDEFDNKSANSPGGYVKTIERALAYSIPWTKENIGHHIVRNNHISNCEQGGIVGSLGAVFSTITGNTIHDIHVRRRFSGDEMAGIKIHAAIDTIVSHNHIYRCNRGLWLDWMAQGAQVTNNLFHDNADEKIEWSKNWELKVNGGEQDMFLEVNHGPILVANNIFLSSYSINSRSQGVAFVHNLIAGTMRIVGMDPRQTPWHMPHSTKVLGLKNHPMGDNRYYNNLFVRHPDLRNYDKSTLPMWMDGNIYLAGAIPAKLEANPLMLPEFDPTVQLKQKPEGWFLGMNFGSDWGKERTRKLVTTELLGRVELPGQGYTNPDGTPLKIDADYFGKPRNSANPYPGPFENPGTGVLDLAVWSSEKK